MRGVTIQLTRPIGRTGRYEAQVQCQHGVTVMPVRRACREGCHHGSDARYQRCRRINPDPRAVRQMAVLLHGRRLGCGCDWLFWMLEGPTLDQLGPAEIQVHEPALTDDEVARVFSTMAIESGEWGRG